MGPTSGGPFGWSDPPEADDAVRVPFIANRDASWVKNTSGARLEVRDDGDVTRLTGFITKLLCWPHEWNSWRFINRPFDGKTPVALGL